MRPSTPTLPASCPLTRLAERSPPTWARGCLAGQLWGPHCGHHVPWSHPLGGGAKT